MNVQHVESLNDVVAQITRVHVRETVPDSVIDRADAVGFVDIAPEELLQRLRGGRSTSANRRSGLQSTSSSVATCSHCAFARSQRTAQHATKTRWSFAKHGVASTWPVGERILVK